MITCLQSGDSLEILCSDRGEVWAMVANLSNLFSQHPDMNTVKFWVGSEQVSTIPLNLVLLDPSIQSPGACFKAIDRRLESIQYWEDVAAR